MYPSVAHVLLVLRHLFTSGSKRDKVYRPGTPLGSWRGSIPLPPLMDDLHGSRILVHLPLAYAGRSTELLGVGVFRNCSLTLPAYVEPCLEASLGGHRIAPQGNVGFLVARAPPLSTGAQSPRATQRSLEDGRFPLECAAVLPGLDTDCECCHCLALACRQRRLSSYYFGGGLAHNGVDSARETVLKWRNCT